jgi:hypothetical protein
VISGKALTDTGSAGILPAVCGISKSLCRQDAGAPSGEQIGRDILDRQNREGWGTKVIERLAQDLRSAFPGMRGFSRANLMYMRAFAEAWTDVAIVQQAVGQLPWATSSFCSPN